MPDPQSHDTLTDHVEAATKRITKKRKAKKPAVVTNPGKLLLGDEYVTIREASAQLHMSIRTFQRRASEGLLPGLVKFGRLRLLHVETFRAGMARQLKAVRGR